MQHVPINKLIERIPEMHPEEIKAALRMKSITQAVLAERLGVTPSLVSQTIAGYGKSPQVQRAIAEIVGKSIRDLWPNQVILRRTRARAGLPAEIVGN
jgi:lambda repressor-like predicted transcriptional regulator